MRAIKKRTQIAGQFVAHRVDMIRSAAWASLSLAARRVLDRLEIEHAEHGGVENGRLPCTYDDFARFGVRRRSVAAALVELQDAGFVEVTRRGRMASADFYQPSLYRLTYLPTKLAAPTDEWTRKVRALKNRTPGADMPPGPGPKTPLLCVISGGENGPTAPGAKTTLLSISRVGNAAAEVIQS